MSGPGARLFAMVAREPTGHPDLIVRPRLIPQRPAGRPGTGRAHAGVGIEVL